MYEFSVSRNDELIYSTGKNGTKHRRNCGTTMKSFIECVFEKGQAQASTERSNLGM